MTEVYQLRETEKHGVFLRINDLDIGDEFDDYLSEEVYVLFNLSLHDDYVEFSFGKAASVSKVKQLVDEYQKR